MCSSDLVELHPRVDLEVVGDGDGHAIGVGRVPGPAEVSGPDDGGVSENPAPAVERERLVGRNLDVDRGPRRDVSDLLGEQAGPLLLEERGGPPFEESPLAVVAGGLAGFHHTLGALALELEGEAGDRPVGRQRQLVGHPQRLGVRVEECLAECRSGVAAAGVDAEAGAAKRQRTPVGVDELGARRGVGFVSGLRHEVVLSGPLGVLHRDNGPAGQR